MKNEDVKLLLLEDLKNCSSIVCIDREDVEKFDRCDVVVGKRIRTLTSQWVERLVDEMKNLLKEQEVFDYLLLAIKTKMGNEICVGEMKDVFSRLDELIKVKDCRWGLLCDNGLGMDDIEISILLGKDVKNG